MRSSTYISKEEVENGNHLCLINFFFKNNKSFRVDTELDGFRISWESREDIEDQVCPS